eukprot:TRINITY_DN1027_c0_g1_i3.p1 TRINITY_DN1027_c0_g1~~TRINITY_DN1027_c0_g1_i3.p1  ORF type:complete len:660 (-),score=138.34 TRINITY_DN1027_c0_g1_i3:52-2031(-)
MDWSQHTPQKALTPLPRNLPKISDLVQEKIAKNEVFFSFEFFPPKTEQGLNNLYARFDEMSKYKPLFVDVTWGAGGRTSELTLSLCVNAKAYSHMEPQMHLTCTNMPLSKIDQALKDCKEFGVRNILALRGDPPRGETEWKTTTGGFAHAVDLVRYIRQQYGDYFSIGVAGYPEKHVDAASYEEDLKHLKEKVDAGADLIITQLFYDADIFLKFVRDCRNLGITVPILPGLMPIRSYDGLCNMCKMCGTSIPQEILDKIRPFKDDDKAVQDYGVQQMIVMCNKLIRNGILGLHFYTLNMERQVTRILMGLGLVKEEDLLKPLPWSGPARVGQKTEEIRPIFWANRPKTYVSRTSAWDDFPNGRWGDAGSPSFSTLDIYHLSFYRGSVETRLKEWGSPKNLTEVAEVFVSYINGKISRLPWNNTQLAPEASVIYSALKNLNSHGFFSINSQPKVNCSTSDHPVYGWGPSGGHVWQKAYVEFFCSYDHARQLQELLGKYPSLQLQSVNKKGDCFSSFNTVTAVTWGVWPGSEIKQPTIVDPEVFFNVWKDEAFGLWHSEWAEIYSQDSVSRNLIEEISDTFYLVNIVDNDFVSGNIFAIFEEIIATETLILVEIEETRKAKIKLLETRFRELEEERKKLEDEKKQFTAEREAWEKLKAANF